MLKSAIVITFFAVQAAKKPEIIDKQSENITIMTWIPN